MQNTKYRNCRTKVKWNIKKAIKMTLHVKLHCYILCNMQILTENHVICNYRFLMKSASNLCILSLLACITVVLSLEFFAQLYTVTLHKIMSLGYLADTSILARFGITLRRVISWQELLDVNVVVSHYCCRSVTVGRIWVYQCVLDLIAYTTEVE